MRNYIQPGHAITLAAPYDVVSGAGLLVGSIFGVASHDALSGAEVETQLTGVIDLAKVASQAWTPGAKVYWDNSAKRVTNVASGTRSSAPRCSPSAAAPTRSLAGCGSTEASDAPMILPSAYAHAALPAGVIRYSAKEPIRRSNSCFSGPRPPWPRNSVISESVTAPPEARFASCRTNTRPVPSRISSQRSPFSLR
jgi:predicted RecA/RadA family phage recombinase